MPPAVVPVPELELEDANGVIYPLEWPGRHAMQVSGLGMPPIRHWTTRAPFQVGRTHWGYAWQPRTVNLVLFLRGCGRLGMWQGRAANIAMLNPANGPHILRLTYPDGNTFEVHDGWYNAGYELSSQDQGHAWQRGGVQVTFMDPLWKWVSVPLNAGETRDVNGRSCMTTSAFVTADQLTLPFVGPFLLGVTTATATLTCVNSGTCAAKPVLTVEGPVDDWTITNATTGKGLGFNGYSIAAGEVVTLDIPNKTVTNNAGTSLVTYLSGDFGTFALEPGSNTVTFWAAGSVVAGTTEIGACWYVEVLGV